MPFSNSEWLFVVMLFGGCVLPSLLAAFDATRNQISTDGNDYKTVNGALAWFLLCLLFPTVGLVFYLVRRALTMDERRRASGILRSI